MGEAGRRAVERKFSCGAQLENTMKLYESLLARAPRAAASSRGERTAGERLNPR
jgi:hypothetical protein